MRAQTNAIISTVCYETLVLNMGVLLAPHQHQESSRAGQGRAGDSPADRESRAKLALDDQGKGREGKGREGGRGAPPRRAVRRLFKLLSIQD